MNFRALGVARSLVRQIFPVSFRRLLWRLFAQNYFDRKSIKSTISHVKAKNTNSEDLVDQLIVILEKNKHQPDYDYINNKLKLDFKGFSSQDLIAYLFFDGKKSGTYIDIGAFDGISISNTYFLEKIGWEGICIEPIPEIFSLLEENRTCTSYNIAIANQSEDRAKFLKVSNLLGLSGLEKEMPERIKQGLVGDGNDIEHTFVKTQTFSDMMKNHPNTQHVDFLSVDVEGAEMEVLKSINFSLFTFALITIENNAGANILKDFMASKGYAVFLDLGVDLMFVPT